MRTKALDCIEVASCLTRPYPNPLPPNEYPKFSSGAQYQGGELFLTFARTENLLDPTLTEVKISIY